MPSKMGLCLMYLVPRHICIYMTVDIVSAQQIDIVPRVPKIWAQHGEDLNAILVKDNRKIRI